MIGNSQPVKNKQVAKMFAGTLKSQSGIEISDLRGHTGICSTTI